MTSKQKLNPMLNMMIRKAAPIAFKEQEYPASFSRTVEIILKERNMFPKELADLLNVNRRTIYRILQDDEYQTTKQMVIGICVVLKLVPQEAFTMLEKAGFRLKMTSAQDAAYFSIISTCGSFSMEDINTVLEDKGFGLIGARQK